jgi:hypothetical protein
VSEETVLLTNSRYDKEQRMPVVTYGHMRGYDEGISPRRAELCTLLRIFVIHDINVQHQCGIFPVSSRACARACKNNPKVT